MDARLMHPDPERFPTLTAAGQGMLNFMREHPHAPLYRNQSGNRLLADEVAALRVFEREVAAAPVGWYACGKPAWLDQYVRATCRRVPHYRASGEPSAFEAIPPVSRADFAADITRFVPDDVPLDRLLNYRTTGTTGHPIHVPSHPVAAARYQAFHKRALRRFGVELTHGAGQVGVVLLGHQERCFTYVSVTPTMGESGLAKLNLHPNDWRDPSDRAAYLDALNPELIAGDPISFTELLTLPLRARPRALLSVSMALQSGLRARLEARFACPVLDIYSLNEVGPVAVYDQRAGGHLLLQPRLYVELLDQDGEPVGQGERGEITVTGGFNDWLPLLRYRTGDHAALAFGGDGPVLIDFCGRAPVRYRGADGRWMNNIEISHALAPLPIAHFSFHQHGDAALELRLAPAALHLADDARGLLARLFGQQPIAVTALHAHDKVRQYSSDLAGAMA
jgi:phenylacetate-CoA ligase